MVRIPFPFRPKTGLFFILLCALPLKAQWNPSATASLGAGMASISLATGNLSLGRMNLARRNGNTTSTAPSRPAAAEHAANGLMFTPSPAVSARLRQTIEQNVLARVPTDKQAEMRQELARFQPVAGFNSVIAKHGYSPYNLADVMTTYWIICWQMVNGTPDPSPATIRAVDNQLRQSLMENATLAKLTSDNKQEMAELMAYEAVFGLTATRSSEARSNPAMLENIKGNIATQFQKLAGLDLHRLDLTPSGFVEKER
jgi:hypothetical protein